MGWLGWGLYVGLSFLCLLLVYRGHLGGPGRETMQKEGELSSLLLSLAKFSNLCSWSLHLEPLGKLRTAVVAGRSNLPALRCNWQGGGEVPLSARGKGVLRAGEGASGNFYLL